MKVGSCNTYFTDSVQWVNCEALVMYSLNLESPTLADINWSGVFIYVMGKEVFSAILNA